MSGWKFLLTFKDGWFVVAVGSDSQWESFCSISGIPPREEWSTNAGRIANRGEIETIIQAWIGHYNRNEVERMLQGIPCAPINTVSEALADAQSVARGALLEQKNVTTLASPLRFMQPQ